MTSPKNIEVEKELDLDQNKVSDQDDKAEEKKMVDLPKDVSKENHVTRSLESTSSVDNDVHHQVESNENIIDLKKLAPSVAALASRDEDLDLKELPDPPNVPEIDNSAFNKAVKAIKRDISERSVMNQLQTIWLLYEECQRKLFEQNAALEKYRKKMTKLDEEARHDKRVMKAIYFADHHRQARLEMEQTNIELEKALKERDELTIPNLSNRIKVLLKDLDRAKNQTKNLNIIQEKFITMEFSYNQCQSTLKTMSNEANAEAAEKIRQNREFLDAILEKTQAEITAIVSDKNLIISTLKRKVTKLSMDNHGLNEELRIFRKGLMECERALERSEGQLKSARKTNAITEAQNNDLQAILEANKSSIIQMELTKRQHDSAMREAKKKMAELRSANERVSAELSRTIYEMDGLRRVNRHNEVEIEKLNEDLHTSKKRTSAAIEQFNLDKKEMEKMNGQLLKGEQDMRLLVLQSENLSKKILDLKTDATRRDSTIHRQDLHNMVLDNLTKRMETEILTKDSKISNFVIKTEKLNTYIKKLQATISECEKNRNALKQYAEYLEKKGDLLDEQLMEEENNTFACNRRNASLGGQMKVVKDMYSQRTEELHRNVNQIKNLVTENLTYELAVKEKANELDKVERNFSMKTRECLQLDAEIQKLRSESQLKQKTINRVMIKNHALKENLKTALLENSDLERMRDFQQGRADMRSAELMLLENRMSLSEKKLNIGTREISHRNKDLSILIIEIKNLRRKVNSLQEQCQNHSVLKERHTAVVKALTLTKAKLVKIEDMKQTMIHPYRHLKAVDSSVYDLHVKINHLTKQLIRKTTEVAEKEDIIIKKTQLFLEFKAMLMRRGDSKETAAELWRVKKSLQLKEREIKSLRAELDTSMHTVSEAKTTLRGEQQKLDATRNNLIKHKKILQREIMKTNEIKAAQDDLKTKKIYKPTTSENRKVDEEIKTTGPKHKYQAPKLPPLRAKSWVQKNKNN